MEIRKKVVMIRHAESLSNCSKVNGFVTEELQADLKNYTEMNVPLSKKGVVAARIAGISLWQQIVRFEDKFDVGIHTGCRRTLDTLVLAVKETERNILDILEYGTLNLGEITSIRERALGAGYHLTYAQFKEQFPKEDDEHFQDKYKSVPPGGESRESLEPKFHEFLKALYNSEYSNAQRFLVVSHAGPMIVAEKIALKIPNGEARHIRKPKNCEAYRWDVVNTGDTITMENFQKLGVMN